MVGPTFTNLDADDPNDAAIALDVDAALESITDHGGDGEWETSPDAAEVERWNFPRFEGAEDEGDLYLSRAGVGPHASDVETIASWLDEPRNIVGGVLLAGEPGCGKTALLEAAVTYSGRTMTTVLCTGDHTKDALFLRFVGEDNGEKGADGERTPYALGPVPHAVRHGHTLYMDEVMLLVDSVKPLLYSLADGRRYLPEGEVDGSAMEIHPDFRLVLSSNPLVRGASMPEPLASRFASTTITVDTSADMLRDLGVDDSVVGVWEGLKTQGLWAPQIRELRLASYWYSKGEEYVAQAVSAMVAEHCPESQREAVTAVAVGFLGGDLRADGRLVVS